MAYEFIREWPRTGSYLTQRRLLNFVKDNCHMTLTHSWTTIFLAWYSASVAKAIVSPQELSRLQTPRHHLDEYINLSKAYIPLVPSTLVFNLDETGLSDWEERRPKPVLVTVDRASQPLSYLVDRGIRH
jgi:hypothetical protein